MFSKLLCMIFGHNLELYKSNDKNNTNGAIIYYGKCKRCGYCTNDSNKK